MDYGLNQFSLGWVGRSGGEAAEPTGLWLLVTGAWEDPGEWDDAATWNDGA